MSHMQFPRDINMQVSSASMGPPDIQMGDSSLYSAGLNMAATDDCSSGFQSASVSNFPSTLPSSASTTVNEYPPQQPPSCVLPPAPPSNVEPERVIEELAQYISNESDKVVLTNTLGLLFSYSINNLEVCRLMSASTVILNALYNLLTSEEYKEDDPILFLATGNLANLSKYEAGRLAIVGCNGLQANEWPSRGVKSLINSLQSRDSNVVIFAITAVHNLLLDRRTEVQEIAKKQINNADGIRYIVQQLAHPYLMNNYEFKVIVLDCLQILAYGNMENRLIILNSGGPRLLLKTIVENFDSQPSEELLETACRVLKSLSVCPANKVDIMKNEGIEILTRCISRNNQEILKTCLWTLRNLSDVINNHFRDQSTRLNPLVERLLGLLFEYSEEPSIITCVLGILANLTCNNEPIKQFICDYNGVELLLNTIAIALRDSRDFKIGNNEILEPAICALCHLLNQVHYSRMEMEKNHVRERFIDDPAFKTLQWASTSEDLAKAVDKLISLLHLRRGYSAHRDE